MAGPPKERIFGEFGFFCCMNHIPLIEVKERAANSEEEYALMTRRKSLS
jgi:hypothetical protein